MNSTRKFTWPVIKSSAFHPSDVKYANNTRLKNSKLGSTSKSIKPNSTHDDEFINSLHTFLREHYQRPENTNIYDLKVLPSLSPKDLPATTAKNSIEPSSYHTFNSTYQSSTSPSSSRYVRQRLESHSSPFVRDSLENTTSDNHASRNRSIPSRPQTFTSEEDNEADSVSSNEYIEERDEELPLTQPITSMPELVEVVGQDDSGVRSLFVDAATNNSLNSAVENAMILDENVESVVVENEDVDTETISVIVTESQSSSKIDPADGTSPNSNVLDT